MVWSVKRQPITGCAPLAQEPPPLRCSMGPLPWPSSATAPHPPRPVRLRAGQRPGVLRRVHCGQRPPTPPPRDPSGRRPPALGDLAARLLIPAPPAPALSQRATGSTEVCHPATETRWIKRSVKLNQNDNEKMSVQKNVSPCFQGEHFER